MELLKNVWQSVTNSESPSVLSLLSMIPSNQQQPPLHQGGKLPPIAGISGADIPMMQPPAVLAPHTATTDLVAPVPSSVATPLQQHAFKGSL
jgi:hypothetical protein